MATHPAHAHHILAGGSKTSPKNTPKTTPTAANPSADARTSGIHIVRRRPTRTQGQALEALGHAVEYLMDSRLAVDQPGPSEQEAIDILKRASRTVFAECSESRSWMRRLRNWLDCDFAQNPSGRRTDA